MLYKLKIGLLKIYLLGMVRIKKILSFEVADAEKPITSLRNRVGKL